MPSAWVKHVQSVYQKGKGKGLTYSQAMQKAKVSWAKKKKTGGKVAKVAKKARKVEEVADEKVQAPKKKARRKKKVKAEVSATVEPAEEKQKSSRKASTSAASRRKAKNNVPSGIAGVGAPMKR